MPIVAWISTALALLPLLMTVRNLRTFSRPTDPPPRGTRVSILIPARDEAPAIERSVRAALASDGVEVEVLVLDDDSSDDTAPIVERIAASDARVRLLRAPPLSAGWAGKQRACWLLAQAARFDVLMFVDVDVQLATGAASAAAGRLLSDPSFGMVSGFPNEVTVSLAEQLVVPWIHVLLLGYLPMDRMRASVAPAYGAACGQWIVTRRDAYFAVGGHAASPLSRHDGTSLPRSFRNGGWKTDVFDGGALARCRMYDGFATVWRGFSKAPGEGMASTRALPWWTVLIGMGHVLPPLLLIDGIVTTRPAIALAGAIGTGANLGLRLLLCRRLGQPLIGALLHPLGAVLMLLNQWTSLLRDRLGRPSEWRGRRYVGSRAT